MVSVIVLALLNVLSYAIGIFIGFWMGRKTQDKPMIEQNMNKGVEYIHGQPVLDEYDAFEEAMNKGSLESTIKEK